MNFKLHQRTLFPVFRIPPCTFSSVAKEKEKLKKYLLKSEIDRKNPVGTQTQGLYQHFKSWRSRITTMCIIQRNGEFAQVFPREPNELWEQKRRTLLTSSSSILPRFESMVSFVHEEDTPRSLEVCRPKEIEENDIPRISIAPRLPASQPVDFFIDNRDSVTSLRDSYGSEASRPLSFPFFQRDRQPAPIHETRIERTRRARGN